MIFDRAVNLVLELEGGYVDDPNDAGGETKYGISSRAYPDLDIKNLTKEHAKFIYQRDYWNKVHASALPDRLRLMVFDTAVNQGTGAAIKILQQTLRVKRDGIFGVKTLNAVKNIDNQNEVLQRYSILRVKRYFNTRGFEHYGRGWINRVIEIITLSLS